MIILASGSTARQTMLRQAGVKFYAMPADLDEGDIKQDFTGPPEALALALAQAKAAQVTRAHHQAWVIGADQLLVCDGQLFNKPENLDEAAAQLVQLSGRAHVLVTAVCVHRGEACLWHHVAQARLTMRPLSASFIQTYLEQEGDGAFTSAGAYRLEGLGAQLFTAVDGDFFTVLGLPLLPLLDFLREAAAIEK